MYYRNIKTGAIVDIPSEVISKVWEKISPEPAKQEEDEKPKAKRKATK